MNKHKPLSDRRGQRLLPEVQQVDELLQDAVELLGVDVVLDDSNSLRERHTLHNNSQGIKSTTVLHT